MIENSIFQIPIENKKVLRLLKKRKNSKKYIKIIF